MALTLRTETKTVQHVRYRDLNKFLEGVYGRKFCFVSDWNTSNDSSHEMVVEAKLDHYDQTQVERWKKSGGGDFMTRTLLCDCCIKGLVPAGDYVIGVNW